MDAGRSRGVIGCDERAGMADRRLVLWSHGLNAGSTSRLGRVADQPVSSVACRADRSIAIAIVASPVSRSYREFHRTIGLPPASKAGAGWTSGAAWGVRLRLQRVFARLLRFPLAWIARNGAVFGWVFG